MKIVHCLTQPAHGPLSYADISSGGRGCTGSEQAMLYLAKGQAEAGHQVVLYMPTTRPGFSGGVEVLDAGAAFPRFRRMDGADVVVSWLTADPLRHLSATTLRIHSLQINDFLLCGYGFDQWVDLFVTVSDAHRSHLWTEVGHPGPEAKVAILPNGVALERFQAVHPRVPRRCVYISSPDRGLHWLLAMWPEIRFAYPDAELHVFYEVQKWMDAAYLLNSEIGVRAKYIAERLNSGKTHGLVVRGAVPPEQLATELLQADVLLYPADTIRFTEGFGSSVLEAHAAGLVPVLTDCDALGEIYRESGSVMIPRSPDRRWTDAFLEAALRVLGDPSREEVRPKVRAFAEQYSWPRVTIRWQQVIDEAIHQRGA